MQTVVAEARQPIIEFSMSVAELRGYKEERIRLICSNSVHVKPCCDSNIRELSMQTIVQLGTALMKAKMGYCTKYQTESQTLT